MLLCHVLRLCVTNDLIRFYFTYAGMAFFAWYMSSVMQFQEVCENQAREEDPSWMSAVDFSV